MYFQSQNPKIHFYLLPNKSLATDVHVRVRRRVVQVPVKRPRIRPVVPVPAQDGSAHPISLYILEDWGETPKPPKEVF